ncbi:MAG TPA: glutamate synthase subunit beta [Polyangiaceae bacterium]|nr:glutamate synthase subunit beta [Polyangiaceae bacterium]
MGKTSGFLEYTRKNPEKLPKTERVKNYREFELPVIQETLKEQGARCMDCGVPFCNTGCPLGNLIPDWNDHNYRGQARDAIASLHSTNNFPEITGRICPAPCEAACVLGINDDPVSIKLIERATADRAIAEGWIVPMPPAVKTGKKVAVIGSGPAGMAAAQQLARAGHDVTVFERDDRIGGLLTYGIPDFKMEKDLVDRRVAQMEAEGVVFKTSVAVGVDVTADQLRRDFDAICLAIGSRVPRDLAVPGRELNGVHYAMDFLTQQNRRVAGKPVTEAEILATGKHVVVIGGGDTGSDCIGTSHRQGALSVTNFEIMPEPPTSRAASTPWPLWPLMLRTSTSHEEGGERRFSVTTSSLRGQDGQVTHLACCEVTMDGGRLVNVPGTEFEIPADLVLLAMGFVHPEKPGIVEQLGLNLDPRGNVAVNPETLATSEAGVFAAGDCQRGQSLVVWGIADGRKAARGIDTYLMGKSSLPFGNHADPRFQS